MITVIVKDKHYNADKDIEDLSSVINARIEEVFESGEIVTHMIIDDMEVYEDYDIYLEDNFLGLKKIELVVRSQAELVKENLVTTLNYIVGAKPELTILANQLKKSTDKAVLAKFDDLLEGIAWLIEGFQSIDSNPNLEKIIPDYELWNEYSKNIYELSDLVKYIRDFLLTEQIDRLSSLIAFDLLEIFNHMEDKLNKMLEE